MGVAQESRMFGIVEVCYKGSPRHIEEVKARELFSNFPNAGVRYVEVTVFDREKVVALMAQGVQFFTLKLSADGSVAFTAKVEPMPMGDTTYLRTKADGIEGDNLGDLDEYHCLSSTS